jgi:hypothetical protein
MLYALRGYRFYRNDVQLTNKELTYELSINFLNLYENEEKTNNLKCFLFE